MNLDEARKKVEEIETYAERWRRGTIPASNARELFSLTRTLIIELEQTKDALAKSRRAHDVTNEAYADEREVYALSVKKENTLQSEKAALQAELKEAKRFLFDDTVVQQLRSDLVILRAENDELRDNLKELKVVKEEAAANSRFR